MRHGTSSTYRHHGCRCTPCTNAHAAYNRDTKAGVRRSTDPGPARAHIHALLDQGWTRAGIARHVGYHVDTISHLASGKAIWTRKDTAHDILSVPLATCAHYACDRSAGDHGICADHLAELDAAA